jgi:tetratricopeptide (TPR) repeat protein
LHFQLGVAYGTKENHDGAMAEFKKAIELDPKLIAAHFNLANVYSLKKMPGEAQKEYEKTIELDPKFADAYLNLGVIYRYQKKDNAKAVESWQKYLDLAPNDPQAKTIQQEILKIVKEETGKQ